MSKQAKALVTGSDGAAAASQVASTSKPTKGQKPAKKTAHNPGDAGVAPNVPVSVISKPQPDGFAIKQMPDDPAWVALLHDLGTMSTMALRAKCQRRRKSWPWRRRKTRPVGEDVRHGARASHIAGACHGALARQGQ
jgi:hypothetical protein